MSKPKRAKRKRPMQPKAAAQQLWAHMKQQLKVDEAFAVFAADDDASRSAFKIKRPVD